MWWCFAFRADQVEEVLGEEDTTGCRSIGRRVRIRVRT